MIKESKSVQPTKPESTVLEECEKLIRDEYDMIEAMRLMSEFDYSIMPVRVRSCENRLEILKDILEKKENAYKNYDKLIELARLLNIGKKSIRDFQTEDNEILHSIKQLIAECALKRRNLSVAKKTCNELIELNYGSAWPCVYNFAYSFALNLIESYQIEKINDNVFLSLANHTFEKSFSYKVFFGLFYR